MAIADLRKILKLARRSSCMRRAGWRKACRSTWLCLQRSRRVTAGRADAACSTHLTRQREAFGELARNQRTRVAS